MLRAFIGFYQAGRTTPWHLQPLGVVLLEVVTFLQKVAKATLQFCCTFGISTTLQYKRVLNIPNDYSKTQDH